MTATLKPMLARISSSSSRARLGDILLECNVVEVVVGRCLVVESGRRKLHIRNRFSLILRSEQIVEKESE